MKVPLRVLHPGFIAVLCTVMCAAASLAQGSDPIRIDSGARKMLASADTAFAFSAAQGGLAEVKLGGLAAEKAADPQLKAFGQQMVDDHTKANDQLKAIAKQESMTLPDTMNAKDQATYNRLSSLSGAAFDAAYAKDMAKDHEMDLKEFQRQAKNGKDPALRNFASQTLPILQQHLDKIRSIEPRVSGGSGKQGEQRP